MKNAVSYLLLILLTIAIPGLAAGEPKLLSDDELDQITASGPLFTYTVDPVTGAVNFGFDTGGTVGNGNATVTPSSSVPSTLNITNGNLMLSNSPIAVQNLILNMNLCVQCKATTIYQVGIGLGVTVNP